MECNENKTLEFLNSKAWYRLLKVIFGLIILLCLIFFNALLINGGIKSLDNGKTSIFCTYGDRKILTPKQIGLEFYDYDFKDGFNYKDFFESYHDNDIKVIFKNCYKQANDDFDIFAAQKVYEVYGDDRLAKKQDERPPLSEDEKKYLDETIPKIENSSLNFEKAKYLNYSIKLFDIKPAYTYNQFIKYFVIGNLLILFFFEFLRRCFYYVILGTIKPKK